MNQKHSCPICENRNTCDLNVRNFSLSHSGEKLLEQVNFTVHCGELVALIGPNGAGKSSLFRAILGDLPYEGEISFSGHDGKRKPPRIGYVPQLSNLDKSDPVTVYDFFAAATSKSPVCFWRNKKTRSEVEKALARMSMDGLMERRLGHLSGGELQRMLLALALEPIPNVLLLDEPFSGVDAEGEGALMALLDELRAQYHLSIMLSTHNFSILPGNADRVLLLKNTILEDGPPEQVLHSRTFFNTFHLREGRENRWTG